MFTADSPNRNIRSGILKLMKITNFVWLVACFALLMGGCASPDQRQSITVKGSDTMVLLGQRWAEVYMKANPGKLVQVTGGGSGTGIAALINGTTDICESSRPIKAEERESVKQQRNLEVTEIPVALDALAVYVNKSNPINSLTLDQIRRIYTGELTNWKDVGGPDAKILLYGRENNSGTYVYFKENVLGDADFVSHYQAMPGTAAVINAITKDPGGIGYGGIGYASEAKALSIATAPGEAVAPTMENVLSGAYPISRQLFWYVAGSPQGDLKAFVDFALSPQGQSIVADVGYYPLKSSGSGR